jgi:hypothetical protein
VIWGGEFGRTPFIQGNLNDRKRWGRDFRLTDVHGKVVGGIMA